jgi:hypothetical protein
MIKYNVCNKFTKLFKVLFKDWGDLLKIGKLRFKMLFHNFTMNWRNLRLKIG